MKHYFVQLKTGIIIESQQEINYNERSNCTISNAIISNINGNILTKNAESVCFNLSDTVLHWSKDADKI